MIKNKSMPMGWEPPAPAWQSAWKNSDDPLVTVYFGIQGKNPALLDTWAERAFKSSFAPLSVERGCFTDGSGVNNFIYIAYWRRSNYQRWWAQDGHASWWADERRIAENVGYWREVITMPTERFETLLSTPNGQGVSVLADKLEGPIKAHGYPGAMRDRIALSATDSLQNSTGLQAAISAAERSDGHRVVVTPPENMCVIRSGQNWSHCGVEEKAYYLKHVHPVLLEGMRFLRDNPIETRCYSMRFVDNKASAWQDVEQSFGLGYAEDVYAFENWAKSHPTHVAIFESFMKMVETFGEQMKLRLWHEVTVLPASDCEFEYIHCHANTGLLI